MRRFLLALLAVLLPAAPHLSSAGEEGWVRGTVTLRGAGREGVVVEFYLEARRTAGGAPFAVTQSGGGGRFALALPPGEYYVWARERTLLPGPPNVTEYHRNPVAVTGGRTTDLEPLALAEAGRDAADGAPPGTGIRGRVELDGAPAGGAAVMVYGEGAGRLIGPGYAAVAYTGPDGSFEVGLPPGSYLVTARKRRDGSLAGRLRPGDLSAVFEGNPVAVGEGEYAAVGVLELHEVDPELLAQRGGGRAGPSSPARLEGRVEGPDGIPLPGQYVLLYRDGGMIGRPDMMSVSGEDGSFSFDLPGGGTYYLGARSTMGGPRQPGEMAGTVSGSPDSSVTADDGSTTKGIVIRMEAAW